MLEKSYDYKISDSGLIERIIDDGRININHIIVDAGSSVPEHVTTTEVYFIIIKGTLSIELGTQPQNTYETGKIVNVPVNTRMVVRNNCSSPLEMFVVRPVSPNL